MTSITSFFQPKPKTKNYEKTLESNYKLLYRTIADSQYKVTASFLLFLLKEVKCVFHLVNGRFTEGNPTMLNQIVESLACCSI